MNHFNLNGIQQALVIAECRSVTGAAKKLHLTPGAVSQQLINLEGKLGFKLFERQARGVRLTDKGRLLLEQLSPHFEAIQLGLQQSQQQVDIESIRLKLTPSFAYKWLVPRLETFHEQHPDIQVQIFAEGALVDSGSQDYDIAIDYGELPYQNKNAQLLFEEWLIPVAKTSYRKKISDARTGAILWEKALLLHDAMPWSGSPSNGEWSHWFQSVGIRVDSNKGHFFNRTDMAMAAAEAGVGVALARQALLSREQATLESLHNPIPANAGYFVVTNQVTPSIQSFVDWLQSQVSRYA